MNVLLKILLLVGFCSPSFSGASSKDAVKLRDVEILTFYHGKMTNGRRLSPVPQLSCIGGTVDCKSFIPKVVQCYNRGWNGYKINWECKTDMDDTFKFDKTYVSCEGYSYGNDPYILDGSCRLAYIVDLADEGFENRASYDDSGKLWGFASLFFLGALPLVIYALFKKCLALAAEENSAENLCTAPPPSFFDHNDYTWRRLPLRSPPAKFPVVGFMSAGAHCVPRTITTSHSNGTLPAIR